MADWFSIAAQVGGAVSSFLGNKKAASSQKASSKSIKKALQEAAAERARGRTAALEYVTPYADSSGADNYIRNQITSRPDILTDSQRIGLEDLTRRTNNNLSVAGMRGSGRAGAAVLADTTRRFLAGATDTNRARADDAAQRMSGMGERARATGVNIETGTSSALAGDQLTTAPSLAAIGDPNANAASANYAVAGNTLGALASLVRNDRKYDKYGAPTEAAAAP